MKTAMPGLQPCRPLWSILGRVLAFMLTAYGGAVPAQELRNIDIIDSMLYHVLGELDTSLASIPGDTLYLIIDGEAGRYENYLGMRIGNFFKERRHVVLRNYDLLSAFDGIRMVTNRFGCTVEYSKPFARSFLGRRYVQRSIHLTMEGQVLEGQERSVRFPLRYSRNYRDELAESRLDELETTEYPFTVGQRSGYSRWQSLIEPVITIAVVSGIIYLFYIQRS
jgi:hypothetical protein